MIENMRGAVAGPKAKPRMPGRSREAHSANKREGNEPKTAKKILPGLVILNQPT